MGSGDEEGGVTVAEETEIVGEGVVVDFAPVAVDEGTHEEEERGLGLVEIGDEGLHDFVVVAGSDDDLSGTVEDGEVVTVHPIEKRGERGESVLRPSGRLNIVGFPLGDVEAGLGDVGIGDGLEAHVIEGLQGADAGGADGDGLSSVVDELLYGLATDADGLGVHLVAFDLFALDGFEGAGTDVEGEFLAVNAVGIEGGENLRGEMEAGGGSCDAAFDLGIDGLVGGLVALLGLAVEVWGDGEFADAVDEFGEGESPTPLEVDAVGCAVEGASFGSDSEGGTFGEGITWGQGRCLSLRHQGGGTFGEGIT